MVIFTELSLFSGAGRGLLATKHLLGWRTVCYVEWDKYTVEVLKARIRDGYLDDAPIWDDAFTFDGRPWAGCVDIITAGFPCQPFSSAGKGFAELDPRNGWPAVIRILREVRPRYAFLENVTRLLSKPYYRRILGDLAEAGFDCEQDCITAEEMGAPHKRERLWIVAHANLGKSKLAKQSWQEIIHAEWHGIAQQVANTDSERLEINKSRKISKELQAIERNGWHVSNSTSHELGEQWKSSDAADAGGNGLDHNGREAKDVRGEWWSVEPELGRVANGVANRVDRLRAIGNGQVPAVVEEAWERLGGDDVKPRDKEMLKRSSRPTSREDAGGSSDQSSVISDQSSVISEEANDVE